MAKLKRIESGAAEGLVELAGFAHSKRKASDAEAGGRGVVVVIENRVVGGGEGRVGRGAPGRVEDGPVVEIG